MKTIIERKNLNQKEFQKLREFEKQVFEEGTYINFLEDLDSANPKCSYPYRFQITEIRRDELKEIIPLLSKEKFNHLVETLENEKKRLIEDTKGKEKESPKTQFDKREISRHIDNNDANLYYIRNLLNFIISI